jgi:hypothetical protein
VEHTANKTSKRKFKKIFKAARGANGRAKCGDLFRAVRKTDPALGIALEQHPADLAVTQTFFLAIMQEAMTLDVAHYTVDLEMLHTAVELVQEDQATMQHALIEQTRLLHRISNHLQIRLVPEILPLPEGNQSHFYICCANADDDMVHLLRANLENSGAIVRVGNDEFDQRWLETEDIVQTCAAFILPLIEGTLRTQVCQHEIRRASSAGLEIIVVYDSDMRRASSIDLLGEREHLPEDLHLLLESSAELVPLGRRKDKAEQMTNDIMRRLHTW